jgi:DNA modification methylase
MTAVVHIGDCREILATLPDASVHAICTDPPYELGFMGKAWDGTGIAYDVNVWRECLRVLKPGGHLLAFGGSRTYHRLACAVEDAGFEVRDQIMWIYGSGFPKSLDVSKAIDSADGRRMTWFGPWLRIERERRGITQKSLAEHFPSKTGGLTGCVANWELGFNIPTIEQFNTLCRVLSLSFEYIEDLERDVIGKAASSRLAVAPGQGADRGAIERDVTVPRTDAARQWSGWGTALKPAHEPIVVARKPLSGTVAANVLAHGTGAINVDGCRIGTSENNGRACGAGAFGLVNDDGWVPSLERTAGSPLGRWPANVIHDGSDEVVALFPDVASGQPGGSIRNAAYFAGATEQGTALTGYGDTGSAARFFYAAKCSAEDRNEGLRDGRNVHPTVKPTGLMRYLVRLVTPPGGTVLDPFTGSGSTGKAAVLEGFSFIGCELSEEYAAIARARIEHAERQPKQQALVLPEVTSGWLPKAIPSNLDLFAAD